MTDAPAPSGAVPLYNTPSARFRDRLSTAIEIQNDVSILIFS